MTDQTLLKVIEVAKRGTGGEKINASNLVRRECQARGINFEEAMKGKITKFDPTKAYGRSQGHNIFDDDLVAHFYRKRDQKQKQDLGDLARAREEMFKVSVQRSDDMSRRAAEAQSNAYANGMRYQTQPIYYAQTSSGSRYIDKAGIEWTRQELLTLHATKRLQLFGYDPLYI